MKDVKRVKENGKSVLKRKRLFLTTLKEGYQSLKSSYPELKIGFSTFAALRPKEVVLAGQAGTHTVCVCTYHQNVKLMLSAANLDNLKDLQESITGFALENLTYQACLAKMMYAAQGVHWRSDQATLCPFISYYKTNPNQKDPEVDNFVVISDYNKHSTTQHFKNKYNAANLMHHKEDFDVEAEWHYFATSHGKGPADGLAGSAKSCARKHALQGNDILTATHLFDFLNDNERFPKVKFSYVSTAEVLEEEKKLSQRNKTSIAVPKIKFVVPSIVPISETSAKVSRDSYGNEGVVVTFKKIYQILSDSAIANPTNRAKTKKNKGIIWK
ncbi:ATP-dependent 6-phosphofructokinase, muscle type [Frankliniella fusca]|uniref:ATP-dependent 6-phosphofructokinase, muscle type n=1 Tax=Frankliniella fusca TaxID=407009 RepID=A0AAE1HER5_9NEOP|nr:ATP-dependent 6-phosphofructokinase, muscle type [Frankliniella fusca]